MICCANSHGLTDDIFGSGMISSYAARLPKPGEFSKALYTIDIGHNDLAYAFQNKDFLQEYSNLKKLFLNYCSRRSYSKCIIIFAR